MKTKKPLKHVLFESREAAKLFLINQFKLFSALPSIAERRIFLLEFKASPEFRVATSLLQPPKRYEKTYKNEDLPVSTMIEINAGPFEEFFTRNVYIDFTHMKEFYKNNHRIASI